MRVSLQTEKDALLPTLSTIVVFSALDSDTLVQRTTGVIVGPATGCGRRRHPTVIDADGNASIAAANSGEVRNEVVSNSVGSVTNEASGRHQARWCAASPMLAGGLERHAPLSNTTYRRAASMPKTE